MKTSKRSKSDNSVARVPPVAKAARETVPQKDEATGLDATSRGERYGKLRLPHERDENTQRPQAPQQVMKRAEQDLADGQVDTDRRGKEGENFDRAVKRRTK